MAKSAPGTWAGRARRFVRRLRARVRRPAARLVYHLDYRGPDQSQADPLRAQKILNHLLREGHVSSADVIKAGRLPLAHLARVHDAEYLASLDDPKVLERIFGDYAVRLDTDMLVAQQRRMAAGTIAAAHLAIDPANENRPVVNLGGGAHHAHRDRGGGFCVFNDVAVAIGELRAAGFTGRILVVDLDLHQGDGTRAVFAQDATVFTFSMHAVDWDLQPAVADLNVELGGGVGDQVFLEALAAHLATAFEQAEPELVFYVAGVDIAHDDGLGSWLVSADAILERDRAVLRAAAGLPLVWVLAGGYGPDAWRHTARSLAWLLGGDERLISTARDAELAHFRRIAADFSPADLTRTTGPEIALSLADVIGDLEPHRRRTRLLGYYSRYGVELALERYGILPKLRELGYQGFRVELDLENEIGDRVRVFSDDGRRELLIEIVLREDRSLPPHRLLSIEWMLLQNPRGRPRGDRPLLPGQEHPGLGVLREVVLMLVMACERLGLDGLLFSPAHLHTAAVAHGLLSFLDPAVEARFLAIEEAIGGMPLADATRAVYEGRIRDVASGAAIRWTGEPMLLPVSEGLRQRLEGDEREQAVRAAAQGLRFSVVD